MALTFNLPIQGYTGVVDLTTNTITANNTELSPNSAYVINITGGGTVTMPEEGENEDLSGSVIYAKNISTDDLTVAQSNTDDNLPKLNAGDANLTVGDGQYSVFIYIDDTRGWEQF